MSFRFCCCIDHICRAFSMVGSVRLSGVSGVSDVFVCMIFGKILRNISVSHEMRSLGLNGGKSVGSNVTDK